MAKVRKGDIRQITIGGREFDPASDAGVTYRLSGFTAETTPNGNGTESTKMTAKLGGFDDCQLSIDPDAGDLEELQRIQSAGEPVTMTLTLAGGQTYSGELTIQGELDVDSGEGQVGLTALGLKFEKI